ncbi:hypothetical protein ACLB2K_038190 [Fragaria x ananassa]
MDRQNWHFHGRGTFTTNSAYFVAKYVSLDMLLAPPPLANPLHMAWKDLWKIKDWHLKLLNVVFSAVLSHRTSRVVRKLTSRFHAEVQALEARSDLATTMGYQQVIGHRLKYSETEVNFGLTYSHKSAHKHRNRLQQFQCTKTNFKAISICSVSDEDILVWPHTKSGIYTCESPNLEPNPFAVIERIKRTHGKWSAAQTPNLSLLELFSLLSGVMDYLDPMNRCFQRLYALHLSGSN